MRNEDADVHEVLCSTTGKPMPKIPLWMAGIDVNFVSDEAGQKNAPSILSLEDIPKSLSADSEEEKTAGEELEEMDVMEVIEGDLDAELDEETPEEEAI